MTNKRKYKISMNEEEIEAIVCRFGDLMSDERGFDKRMREFARRCDKVRDRVNLKDTNSK